MTTNNGEYTPSPALMADARAFRDTVLSDDDVASMTLSGGGRSVTLTRDRQSDTDQAEPTFQPPVREALLGDPDAVFKRTRPRTVFNRGGDGVTLEYVECPHLTRLADLIIEHSGERYGILDRIEVMYLWTDRTGKIGGEPRLVQLKKPDPLTLWALNQRLDTPRTPDVLVLLNSYVAMLAEMTNWQVQAAVHTALECITWREGKPHLLPPESGLVRNFILRRYGAWNDSLLQTYKALHAASTSQMSLFGDGEDEGDDDGVE